MKSKAYIALLHHPVYNKKKEVVTTCITGFDLHDIARSALTYGISKYYVVNPMPAQLKFAKRIVDCWATDESYTHNWTRAEAFKILELRSGLDEVIAELKDPVIVATSAKKNKGAVSYEALKKRIKKSRRPYLFLFGTGWGLTDEVLNRADVVLAPVLGPDSYNHLSVRSAVAIILDRLFGLPAGRQGGNFICHSDPELVEGEESREALR